MPEGLDLNFKNTTINEYSKTTNERMENKINIDTLLVTELSKDGLLARRDISIPHPHANILSQLQDMLDNPNRSLPEMQDLFKRDTFSKDEHNICLLHEYDEAYVHAVKYPEFITYQEYNQMISDKKNTLAKTRDKYGKFLSSEQVRVFIEDFIKTLKQEFFGKAERYIHAEDYMSFYRQTVLLDSLKIISEERIGWSTYQHQPNSDTSFRISTNFGYGRSAYFRVNMSYKGVDILPYSHIVTYAIAKMEDLVRATRNYSARRENWPMAMDFMIETSNLAKHNEEEFLKVWLKNEVDEMMCGLRRVCSNPEFVMNKYEETAGEKTPYLAVRNFTPNEVSLYKAHKEEMNVSLKATKMSGALMFLDNLQKIAKVFGYVDVALLELKDLALSIIPEVERLISSLKMELETLIKELEEEKNKLKSLEKKTQPYKLILEKLYLECESVSYNDKKEIERKYKSENKEYAMLVAKISNQQQVVWNKEALYSSRENFYDSLIKQKEVIISQAQKIEQYD